MKNSAFQIRHYKKNTRRPHKPVTKIRFKKVTDKMIDNAYAAIENRVAVRAFNKLRDHVWASGQSLNGINDTFSDSQAEQFAAIAYGEELAGLPMPPDNTPSELGGFLSKAWKKIKKAVKKIGDKIRPIIKKVAAPVLAAVVTIYAGPVAGKMVASAMGKAVGAVVQKKISGDAYKKAVKQAQEEYDAWNAANPEGDANLPIGVTQAQAEQIIAGKVPAGMTEEKVWHAVQQAKLIAENGMDPKAAYIAHYHGLQMDAPPYSYSVDADQKLIDALDIAQQNLKKAETDVYIVEDARRQFLVQQAKGSGYSKILQSRISQSVNCSKNPARVENGKIVGSPYCLDDLLTKSKQKFEAAKQAVEIARQKMEASKVQKFEGAPYGVNIKDKTVSTMPVTSSPATSGIANTPTKEEAVSAVLSPEITAKVEEAAKQVLATKGIDIQTQAGQDALKLQIEQLQQQVAEAMATNQQVITVPAYTPQPPVVVEDNGNGTDTVNIPATESKSSAGALLLPAIGLFLALKGG